MSTSACNPVLGGRCVLCPLFVLLAICERRMILPQNERDVGDRLSLFSCLFCVKEGRPIQSEATFQKQTNGQSYTTVYPKPN